MKKLAILGLLAVASVSQAAAAVPTAAEMVTSAEGAFTAVATLAVAILVFGLAIKYIKRFAK